MKSDIVSISPLQTKHDIYSALSLAFMVLYVCSIIFYVTIAIENDRGVYESILVVPVKYPTLKFVIELWCHNIVRVEWNWNRMESRPWKMNFIINQERLLFCSFHYTSSCRLTRKWHLMADVEFPSQTDVDLNCLNSRPSKQHPLSWHSDMSLYVLGPVPW